MKRMLVRMKEHRIMKEMTPILFLIGIVSSLGAASAGYDSGWWSTFMTNQSALKDYGSKNPATGMYYMNSKYQSAGTGLGNAGIMLGALLFAPVGEIFGRKMSIIASSIVSIIGAIISCSSSNSFWCMVMGRFINSFGIGIANAIVPIYLSETAPASIRGTLTSFYQWFYTFGQFWAFFVIYFTYDYKSKWSYMTVIVVQVVIPAMMLILTPFLVESPRWLISKGKTDRAKISLSKIYGRMTNHNIDQEISEVKMAHELLVKHRKDCKYVDLFKGVNLRRTLLAIAVPCFLYGQGVSFMSSYLVLFLVTLGVGEVQMIMLIIMAVLLVTNTFSFWGTDKFGRRPVLLIPALAMGISFYIVAGASYYVDTSASRNTAVAFLFIWSIIYGATWAPLTHITAAEIPSSQLREKTLSVATFLSFGISMMISFVNPFIQNEGYGNLQGRVGFMYGSISFIACGFIYFFLPEVKGLSLDVVDTLFELNTRTSKFYEEGKKLMKEGKYLQIDTVLSNATSREEAKEEIKTLKSNINITIEKK
ncbi:uncharacterized protein PRCAT00001427001 [Priceomyces carsonii]|uniref:uncharacterized protein n=1 Tax=Priceomyces carsonii TaxID=28549 RepID=UPI002EDA0F6A|nr:unnamed protein product [Priceomyces carsonii]